MAATKDPVTDLSPIEAIEGRLSKLKDRPLLAQGDRDDRGIRDQSGLDVAVASDVVAERAVVPVDQDAVEARVDVAVRPVDVGRDFRRERQRIVAAPAVDVVAAVGLLPARRRLAAEDLHLVEGRRMERPERGEAVRVRQESLREFAALDASRTGERFLAEPAERRRSGP